MSETDRFTPPSETPFSDTVDELRARAYFAVQRGGPDWELIRDLMAVVHALRVELALRRLEEKP